MPVTSSMPGYPCSFGSRSINIVNYQGQNNYQQGGESLNSSQFGWGSFDRVSGSQTYNANNSGNYTIQVRYPVNQAAANSTGAQTVQLVLVAANGTEVANNSNLSGEYARVELIGG